jgi:hypothetical protein
MSNFLA